jgi:hypothetical protein
LFVPIARIDTEEPQSPNEFIRPFFVKSLTEVSQFDRFRLVFLVPDLFVRCIFFNLFPSNGWRAWRRDEEVLAGRRD